MDSEINASDDEKDHDTAPDVSKSKKKTKKKTKGKRKGRATKLPKDYITNERGELVTLKEYTLGKTYMLLTRDLIQPLNR